MHESESVRREDVERDAHGFGPHSLTFLHLSYVSLYLPLARLTNIFPSHPAFCILYRSSRNYDVRYCNSYYTSYIQARSGRD